jgi:hypothetical protein
MIKLTPDLPEPTHRLKKLQTLAINANLRWTKIVTALSTRDVTAAFGRAWPVPHSANSLEVESVTERRRTNEGQPFQRETDNQVVGAAHYR